MSLLLKNVRLVDRGVTNILIGHGKIRNVGGIVKADKVINVEGKYVLPGLIDCHVHFRDLKQAYKEDWFTGSCAAAAGGITTVLDMPNNEPAILTVDALDKKREFAKKSIVDYGFHFGASNDNIEEIKKAKNIASVKVYMDTTTGNMMIENDSVLKQIFDNSKIVSVHAEGDSVKKAIELCKNKLYLCHISSKEEIDFIKDNKTDNIFVEVTPHHLFLAEGKAIMKPKLGTKADQKALWEAVKSGIVDTIATDHAPHTKKEKKAGSFGVTGVETMLPLLLDAVNNGKLGLKDVVKLTSTNPAKIFGIMNKGRIAEGYDADLVVVDMDLKKKIVNEKLFTKCKNSPYEGRELQGWPVMTIVNGNVVYDHGEINDIKGCEVEFK